MLAMKTEPQPPLVFSSISALHRALGLPKPLHPLVSLVNYADVRMTPEDLARPLAMDFYKISFKSNFRGQVKYGQQYYDFEEGGLSFFAPNQLITAATAEEDNYSGYTLLVHPDFIRPYPLGSTIKDYGFFSYAVAEALCLSEGEKTIIVALFAAIEQELARNLDGFSQDILVTQIEQLLSYSNRFYHRQFLTRKAAHHDLVTQVEALLSQYLTTEQALVTGLPTVQYLADQLRVSPRYLGDLLRLHTGQNAQQHIHHHLLEKAKELLSTRQLSVAQVGYQLGFEHSQSFNKFFKHKTNLTPLAFRQSFN
jgi:AraC family transcriptional activator of pobA